MDLPIESRNKKIGLPTRHCLDPYHCHINFYLEQLNLNIRWPPLQYIRGLTKKKRK